MAKRDLYNLLVSLEKDLKKDSAEYRRLVSDTKIHALTVEKNDLKKQIKTQMLRRGGFKSLPDSIEKIIDTEVDAMFDYFKKALHPSNFEGNRKTYYTSDFKATNSKLTVMIGVKEGKGTRNVFAYFRRIKQRAQKSLVKNLNQQIRRLNNSRTNKLEEVDPRDFIDIGHSEGSAVSNQRKAAVKDALFTFSSKNDPTVKKYIKELSTDIELSATKRFGKGKDYIEISLESTFENKKHGASISKEAGAINKKLLALTNKLELTELKGSMSSREIREAEILNGFAEVSKSKNGKVKSNIKKKKVVKKSSKASKTSKTKAVKGAAFKDNVKAGAIKFGGDESRKQSNITLFALLNSKLPETVVRNMKPPRLENRTGRFASSVKVTDISKTRQGYMSVGYTYEKSPYQVYESTSGSRFSDVERDPRTLIDASIRQIAAQLVTTRLYTRRN
jgi:hypothetical protein